MKLFPLNNTINTTYSGEKKNGGNQLGTFWAGGKIGKEPYESHVHDFDQVMVWIGADTCDLEELGAESEQTVYFV